MNDVPRALAVAWDQIRPILQRDPIELLRRLARRRSVLLQSPPRAWCFAVRACDTRLDGFRTSSPRRAGRFEEHHVLLDRRALRSLCAPVHIPRPGLPLNALCALLGTTAHGLREARISGVFQTHFVEGLGGHCGKPRPLLYTHRPLDPSARSFACPDPVWSGTADDLLARIPPDIEVLLTRVPLHQATGPNYDDLSDAHPENPALDPPPRRNRRNLRDSSPPPRDFVWYKWKDGEYLGCDWRNPVAAARYHQRQQRLARIRDRVNQRRREHPPASQGQGARQFRGWRWLCPGCRRKVNLLFYPLPRLHLLGCPLPAAQRRNMKRESRSLFELLSREALVECPQPLSAFACEKCHRIKRTSRADPNSWNELVTYLSAGLLFGREVQRPPWYPRARRAERVERAGAEEWGQRGIDGRKIDFTPRPNARPSVRRPQIRRLLLSGFTFRQIAAHLRICYGTVLWHAQQVYKQHNVRSLNEFLNKHGIEPKLTKREEVRRRIARGESVAQIATEMGISRMCVYNHVYMLRRGGKVLPRMGHGLTRIG